MKNWTVAVAVAALALAVPAHADLCTIEATPAATLLLPYFEVPLDDDSVDTIFTINNASAEVVLTHVILWGDWSVEALDFNVFLTGYDVQPISLGLIIRDGILPVTGDSEGISPTGNYSIYGSGHPVAIDVYPGCVGVFPYPVPALTVANGYLTHLQSILTGGPSDFYLGCHASGICCGGEDFGDNVARGYVTVDVVNDCTLLRPCELGYFTSAAGVPYQGVGEYDNVLWGDWYIIDYENNFAQGETLVHVEAADPFDQIAWAQLTEGTFYNRCNAPDNGIFYDLREPLGTTFSAHYYQNAVFDGGTDFLVWKDSQFPTAAEGYRCAAGPNWWPIPESQVIFFDEEENPETVCTISPCPQDEVLFPLETNRVSIHDIEVTPESGWVYLNLNQNYGFDYSWLAQAWVTTLHSALGRFSAGLDAIQLDSFCDGTSYRVGPEGEAGFEPVCNFFTGICSVPLAHLPAKAWAD